MFTLVCDLLEVAATGCWWEMVTMSSKMMNLWAVGTDGCLKRPGQGDIGIYLLVHHRIIGFGKDLGDLGQPVTMPCTLSHVVVCCIYLVFEHFQVSSGV